MRLFITGKQKPDYIYRTLKELDDSFGLSCVIGSACSPCMEEAYWWCEENEIPVYLHLPSCLDELGVIECNIAAIKSDRPEFLMIYDESDRMIEAIAEAAKVTSSVQYTAKKDEE